MSSKLISFRILILFVLYIFAMPLYAKEFVVVIDAGHGGKDFGALGKNGTEKNINLAVALKVGDLISKNIEKTKVVYTREDDRYLTLQRRADIANEAHGNIFISIHTNSIAKNAKNRTTIKGASCYTLGLHRTDENLAVAIRENSVIELEDNYTTAYKGFDPSSSESYIIFEINQSKHMEQSVELASSIQEGFVNIANRLDKGVRQAGFWVLAATSMPAVLVELDFICNPVQEAFLLSNEGQDKMAMAIYKAIDNYKKSNDKKLAIIRGLKDNSTLAESKEKVQESPKKDVSTVKNNKVELVDKKELAESHKYSIRRGNKNNKNDFTNKDAIVYKIQILSSTTEIPAKSPDFKGMTNVEMYKEKGLYKYTCIETESLDEAKNALTNLRRKFKGAFIVGFKNGERIK